MARKKGARSVPAQLAIGSAADLGFLLVLTAIASALVLSGVIGQGSIPTASLCANALAAFAGSLIAARLFAAKASFYAGVYGRVSAGAAAWQSAVCERAAGWRALGCGACAGGIDAGVSAGQREAETRKAPPMKEILHPAEW